jgi:hypothetical protein
MKMELSVANCFWLILPLLAWNIILGPRVRDTRITSDAHSPKWLLMAENAARILVFGLPLLMPLPRGADWRAILTKAGLVYFATWLPLLSAPASAWSNSTPGLLAVRLTPYLSFLGIAILGYSWVYGVIAAVFILLHTWHRIQNL